MPRSVNAASRFVRYGSREGDTWLDDDTRFRLISQTIDGFIRVVRTVFIVGGVIWVASYAKDAFIAFAGKHTDANLAFNVLANLHADRWFAYLFGVGGAGYGLVERRLKRRTIERLTARTEELELRLDPARTSSQLTPEGTTRREDR